MLTLFTPQRSAGAMVRPTCGSLFILELSQERWSMDFVSTCTIFICNQAFPSLGFISEVSL